MTHHFAKLFKSIAVTAAASIVSFSAMAQAGNEKPDIHFVWMGGNDCPPCVMWRRIELPLLEKSDAFQSITFTHVTKPVTQSVPPAFFLPAAVKPYKAQLDAASAGVAGSPQAAILVNGEVFDYFHGTRTAEQIGQMVNSIATGSKYPFPRCLKASTTWRKCETPA